MQDLSFVDDTFCVSLIKDQILENDFLSDMSSLTGQLFTPHYWKMTKHKFGFPQLVQVETGKNSIYSLALLKGTTY